MARRTATANTDALNRVVSLRFHGGPMDGREECAIRGALLEKYAREQDFVIDGGWPNAEVRKRGPRYQLMRETRTPERWLARWTET